MSKDRWPMLPGGEWANAADARDWFLFERDRLLWTARDVERAFEHTAGLSDLYIGRGGGTLFKRPTAAQQRKFLEGGVEIPDWMYWIPLAISHAKVRSKQGRMFEAADWAVANVPQHRRW